MLAERSPGPQSAASCVLSRPLFVFSFPADAANEWRWAKVRPPNKAPPDFVLASAMVNNRDVFTPTNEPCGPSYVNLCAVRGLGALLDPFNRDKGPA
jgi:hypothetical protein